MRKYLLLLVSFVLTGTMMARQLTPDEALALALGKMNAAQPERTRALSVDAKAVRASLTHTEMMGQEVALYYVYDLAEGGFIIASADDRASGLLGYADSGNFAGAQQNLPFMAWLKDCRKALSAGSGTSPLTLSTSVSPLLGEIRWNQDAPYNLLTPLRVGKKDAEAEPDTVHAPTGCAATAMSQVMMYHQWPVTGTGSHTNKHDSLQTVDFSQSAYQWSMLQPAYQGDESEESLLAVAKLVSDVGCALDMDYGYDFSGATISDNLRALATYFGYDKSMRIVYRTQCSTEEWNDLLMTELNEKRPIIFRANAVSGGGHEFVVDGYDTNGLYHVNWGWGGLSNGYFDMNLMDPDSQGIGGYEGGYTIGQAVILGVRPDVDGTSVTRPELVVTKHFKLDNNTKQWTYRVCNNGLGDFTGETGIAMVSPAGEVTRLTTDKHDDEPIVFFQDVDCSFDTPDVSATGYKLYPYYCDVAGGEMKRIPAPYNSFCTLLSVEEDGEYVWNVDVQEVADIEVDTVIVKHNYVGFDPLLHITLSNSAASLREYAEDINVDIYTMVDGEEKKVCSGSAQAFIGPGETKEIFVRCNTVEDEFRGKILAGEYTYYLFCGMGGRYYQMKDQSFEMVNIPPSDITYSDFAVSKTELLPGEELTASMTVTNDGGYDVRTLEFVMQRISDNELYVIRHKNVDIEAGSRVTFTFRKVLPDTPDEYKAAFYVNGEQLDGVPSFRFAVVDPTALDKVSSAPDPVDGMSGIYDLQGRPVQQVRKGAMYIGKGKFVVK